MLDKLLLARLQFGATTVFHFFFVPLTLGLAIFLAIMETAYVRTGDEKYKRMTKFWGKLFLLNFAMGVVTGIVQEFQFGMAWSEYSRFVGDIFGAPLAVEALMAFFIESTFIGVWIFGWDKLSKGMHLAAIWLVAISSNLSALWILIANSWMQQPVGYVIRNGRAEMTDFIAILTNPNVWVQWPHVVGGGMMTAAFFVLGISAYHLIKQKDDMPVFRTSFRWAAAYGIIAALITMVIGHEQAQHMVEVQPMKMAAAEALWDSEDPAAMSLFTVGDESERRDVFAVKLPGVLSLLAFNRFSGEVQGINELQAQYVEEYGPGNYVPPVAITYWSFRIMVGAGVLMLGIAVYALHLIISNQFEQKTVFLHLLIPAITLPYIANTSGWIMAEVGRQPWIVFGLQQTADGISPSVTGVEMLITLIMFVLLYGALMVIDLWLLWKYASRGVTGDGPTLKEFFGDILPPYKKTRAADTTAPAPTK